ncbi:MAG TPA: hypothetical protein ENJ98_01160 [Thiolapillus brandeum]|uniref:Uncharacterized protein n=1 Tax=Thiolapillus brandeum TaxID=1076588 RepID=A0A7C5N292_9GAMM|nr:hypothetical protein [Thiolapillus brandeum]
MNHRLLARLALSLLLLPALAAAGEDGRYQAVVLHSAGTSSGTGSISPKVFILDTRDGHMWTWEQNARVQRKKGGLSFGNILTYQGRLHPGSRAGEVISEGK